MIIELIDMTISFNANRRLAERNALSQCVPVPCPIDR